MSKHKDFQMQRSQSKQTFGDFHPPEVVDRGLHL